MNFKTPKTLLSIFCMFALLSFASCGDDDDKVNCTKLITEIEDAFDAYDDAYDDGNCEDLDDLYDNAVKLLKKGKNCDNVKAELKESGYDNMSDFLDDYATMHEDYKDSCGDPK